MSDPLNGCEVTEVNRGNDTIIYVETPEGVHIVAAHRTPGKARALASDLAREVRPAPAPAPAAPATAAE